MLGIIDHACIFWDYISSYSVLRNFEDSTVNELLRTADYITKIAKKVYENGGVKVQWVLVNFEQFTRKIIYACQLLLSILGNFLKSFMMCGPQLKNLLL